LQRNQALAKLQVVARQDLDQAMIQLAVKKAQVDTINAQIARNQAILNTTKLNLAYTRI